MPAAQVILPAGVRSVDTAARGSRVAPMAQKRSRRRRQLGPSQRPVVTADPLGEIGTSGLRQYGGFVQEEWLTKLRGRYGAWAYREMMDNSPIAGGIIFAVKMLARQVEWRVEDDVKLAGLDTGFVESCMHDMSHTWLDLVSEILSMLGYGWAFHETVYKRRQGGDPLPEADYLEEYGSQTSEDTDEVPPSSRYEDGRIGWRRIPIRAQETLMRWHFRGYAGLRAMEQVDWHGGKHVIPIGKALLFRTETTRQNPEGRSILRNAWTSYYAIQNIQAIEAIGIERDLAGIPVAAPPPGVDLYSPENEELLERVQELVTSIRRDEDEGIVKPTSDWTLELLSTGGSRQIDTDTVIRRYENRMTTSVLADFLMIGQDSVGSYAMVDVKSELFGVAIDAILDLVCEVFNRYAIPRLLALNGIKPDTMPRIDHSSAGRIDLRLVGEFLTNLSLAGAQIPWSKTLIEHFFRAGALPQPEWDNLMDPAQPSPAAHDSQWRPSWGSENGPGQEPPPPPMPTERDHIAKAEEQTGAMVALYPSPALAEHLAQQGGEGPDELHLTLAFLGRASDITEPERLRNVVQGFAAATPPLDGRISGAGKFTANDQPCVYATPDVPGLAGIQQQLVDHLGRAGFAPSAEHGFTPHITLAYDGRPVPQLPPHSLKFDRVSLVLSGQRHDYDMAPEGVGKAETRPREGTLVDLSPVLARRALLLTNQLEREIEQALTELGAKAAGAYATTTEKAMSFRDVQRRVGKVMASTRLTDWVRQRLQPILRNHAARVAADTARTVGAELGQRVALPDGAVRAIEGAAGKHLKARDLEPQMREAIEAAIVEGFRVGENPMKTAQRIRQSVPAGRFRHAGAKWRAQLIARDETANLQRQATLASYQQMGNVSHVQVSDGIYGPPRSDQTCIHRNGEVVPVDEAATVAPSLHPLCTVSYSPIVTVNAEPAPA